MAPFTRRIKHNYRQKSALCFYRSSTKTHPTYWKRFQCPGLPRRYIRSRGRDGEHFQHGRPRGHQVHHSVSVPSYFQQHTGEILQNYKCFLSTTTHKTSGGWQSQKRKYSSTCKQSSALAESMQSNFLYWDCAIYETSGKYLYITGQKEVRPNLDKWDKLQGIFVKYNSAKVHDV